MKQHNHLTWRDLHPELSAALALIAVACVIVAGVLLFLGVVT